MTKINHLQCIATFTECISGNGFNRHIFSINLIEITSLSFSLIDLTKAIVWRHSVCACFFHAQISLSMMEHAKNSNKHKMNVMASKWTYLANVANVVSTIFLSFCPLLQVVSMKSSKYRKKWFCVLRESGQEMRGKKINAELYDN